MRQQLEDQAIGSFVNQINSLRDEELIKLLGELEIQKLSEITSQDENLKAALASCTKVREFLSAPHNILGSDMTKHGEVAEHIEVGISNARRLVQGMNANATFEGVGRTAPEDYLKDGIQVQSKFINSPQNTLKHVMDHMDKYEYFARDNSYYEIPKDYHELLLKIHNGENIEGIRLSTYENILGKIKEIELKSGKDFSEVIKPSLSTYKEVQLRTAYESVERHENEIKKINHERKSEIEESYEKESKIVKDEYSPNFGESLKVAGTAALFSGGLSFTLAVYQKRKKYSFDQFSEEDWKEIGITSGKGAVKGGVSGFSIYHLTNYTKLSAPVAAAYVSATFGVAKLFSQYHKGEIPFDKFVEQCEVVCFESSLVMAGAAVGQTLIPIPILGAVIGSITAGIISNVCKKGLSEREKQFMEKLQNRYSTTLDKLDEVLKKAALEIYGRYRDLDSLSTLAFSLEYNSQERFHSSQKLAREHGVSSFHIMRNLDDVDDFFCS